MLKRASSNRLQRGPWNTKWVLVAPLVLACGSGSITSSDTSESETTLHSDTTETGETGEGDETGPSEAQLAEIAGIEDELQSIVDSATAHFLENHPAEDGPEATQHLCPHPSGSPSAGEASPTPTLDLDCNEGPQGLCSPSAAPTAAGEYDSIFWTQNSVWMRLAFEKTEPHSFHYNFVAANEVTGYGHCTFAAQAFADLDGDFVFSTYELRGDLHENGGTLEELFVDMPFE